MAKVAVYAEKVFVYLKDGERKERVFNMRGKNKDARDTAEILACIAIKKMVVEEGCDYLLSYFRNRLN